MVKRQAGGSGRGCDMPEPFNNCSCVVQGRVASTRNVRKNLVQLFRKLMQVRQRLTEAFKFRILGILVARRCACVSVHVRARVMGSYSESEKASQHREMLSNAVAALLLSGRNRQRRFPGTTLMMHGAPALVLAQHLGRNLRFKGSRTADMPRASRAYRCDAIDLGCVKTHTVAKCRKNNSP